MTYEAVTTRRQKVRYNSANPDNPLVTQLNINGQKQTPSSATITIYAPGNTTALVDAAACTINGTLLEYDADTTTVASWPVDEGYRAEYAITASGVVYQRVEMFDVAKFLLNMALVRDTLLNRDDELLAMQFANKADLYPVTIAARDELQLRLEAKAFADQQVLETMVLDTGKFSTAARPYVLMMIFESKGDYVKADRYAETFNTLWTLFVNSIGYDVDGDGEEASEDIKPIDQRWRL